MAHIGTMGLGAEKDGTRQRGKINNVKLRVLDLSRVWTSSERASHFNSKKVN